MALLSALDDGTCVQAIELRTQEGFRIVKVCTCCQSLIVDSLSPRRHHRPGHHDGWHDVSRDDVGMVRPRVSPGAPALNFAT